MFALSCVFACLCVGVVVAWLAAAVSVGVWLAVMLVVADAAACVLLCVRARTVGGLSAVGVCSGEGASWARLDGAGMAEGGGGVSSADGIGCVGLADGTPGRPLRGGPSKGVGLADPLRAVRLGPVPSVLLRVPMA